MSVLIKELCNLIYNAPVRKKILNIFLYHTPMVVNKYHLKGEFPENHKSIMRPFEYGNPFTIYQEDLDIRGDDVREVVVIKHLLCLLLDPIFIKEAKLALRGQHLVCCCSPKLCHGNILSLLSNDYMLFLEKYDIFLAWLRTQSRMDNSLVSQAVYDELLKCRKTL